MEKIEFELEKALQTPSLSERWQAYEKCRDSGVEWVGIVPRHWISWKITHAFQVIGSGTTPLSSNVEYYDGDIPWVNTSELRDGPIFDTAKKITVKALNEITTLRIYPSDTLLIALYGATIGRVGILHIPATINQACCALSGSIRLDVHFVFYWLIAHRQLLISLAEGGGQPNINQEIIRSLHIPAPSLPEQHTITAFLDRETTKIDALIEKKEQLIARLQEKRAALISQAVTRGLNSDAPMKASGVEWLGMVPKHWEVRRIKSLALDGLVNGLFKKKDQYGTGVKLVNVVDIYKDTFQVDLENVGRVEITDSELKAYGVKSGDIFFVRSSLKLEGVGASACIAEVAEPIVFECHLVRLRPDIKQILSLYLTNYLNSSITRQRLIALANTTTMTTISQYELASLEVPVPPINEQKHINSVIFQQTTQIDTLISRIREAIEKVKEYRVVLISAAVTGKIDVRGEMAREENVEEEGAAD